MCFMQTESVLQTKNRSGPAKNRFSVALETCLERSSIEKRLHSIMRNVDKMMR